MATKRAGARTRKKQFVEKGSKLMIGANGIKLKEGDEREINGTTYTHASLDGQTLYNPKKLNIDTHGKESNPRLGTGFYISDYADYDTVLKPDASEVKSEATKQKNPAENIGERQKSAGRKKEGRGSLRISAEGNGGGSAGRLKKGVGGRRKRSSGAQGGGRSGLNIPR